MKIKFYKSLLLVVASFLFFHTKIFSAVLPGTLISTPDGLIPIESLQVGDTVIGCDLVDGIKHTKIAMTTKKEIEAIVIVETKKENLYTSEKQKFYDPTLQQWVAAKNITKDTTLVDCYFNYIPCIHVQTIQKKTTAYEISLETPHTFFIGSTQILTHNIAPIILAFAPAIPYIAPTLSSVIYPVTLGIGMFLGKLFFESRYQKRCKFKNSLQHKTLSNPTSHELNTNDSTYSTSDQNNKKAKGNREAISSRRMLDDHLEIIIHGEYELVKPKNMSLKKCLKSFNIPLCPYEAREQHLREKRNEQKRH